MKKFLLFVIVLVSFAAGNAQSGALLMNENFSGYSNGNLEGLGGTYAWTQSDYFATDGVQVAKSAPIFYPGYTSGSQYITLVQGADNFYPYKKPDDPYKRFISGTSVSTTTNTTYYMSFVVKVANATNTPSLGTARPELALLTSNGNNLANFYLADNGSNLKFGIGKDGSQDGVYSTNYSFGSTYLIVLRYDLAINSSSNDKMYMWVNPSLAAEPSVANADISITSGSDGGFSGNIYGLQLFQEQYSATASFDGFKVSYAKGYSTPANTTLAAWNFLSPVGAPLPVKFGEIKGYEKGKGIQLDWNVYTELNVKQYEIERSTDGVSFTTVGIVQAKNQDGTLYYDWYDAGPSAGNNFYRIKNLDNDNKYSYSSTIRVSLGASTSTTLRVYPNPATSNHISFQAADLEKGKYTIEIFNTMGQQVYLKQMEHAGGTVSQTLQLPAGVTKGIYNIRITGGTYNNSRSFLIQ